MIPKEAPWKYLIPISFVKSSYIFSTWLYMQSLFLFEKRNLNKELRIVVKVTILQAGDRNHRTIGSIMKASEDRSITHLQAVRTNLQNHHKNMITLLTMDLSKISIVEKEEHCLVTVNISKNISFEEEVEMITAEIEKYHLGRLHDAS